MLLGLLEAWRQDMGLAGAIDLGWAAVVLVMFRGSILP